MNGQKETIKGHEMVRLSISMSHGTTSHSECSGTSRNVCVNVGFDEWRNVRIMEGYLWDDIGAKKDWGIKYGVVTGNLSNGEYNDNVSIRRTWYFFFLMDMPQKIRFYYARSDKDPQ